MATAPTSHLSILKGIPFNQSYENILLFTDDTSKYNYFITKAKYTGFADFTYIRTDNGKTPLRVGINIENLRECNYIMYQNTAYGNKWFYAFITELEYKNDDTTFIYFEEDTFQTWNVQADIKPAFIEREHTNNDTIGANTVPENLELGPYITTAQSNKLLESLIIYILATETCTASAYYFGEPNVVGGFPVPCYWASLGAVSAFSIAAAKAIIDDYAANGKIDAIIAIFTVPYPFFTTGENINITTLTGAARTLSITPKNNKLYTFPYCALSVVAGGSANTMRYELFTGTPSFKIRGGFGPNMQVTSIPQNYEGQTENVQNQLTIKDWPVLPWVSNYFQNWLAQNKANLISGAVNSVVSLGAAAAAAAVTGGVSLAFGVGAAANGVAQISNTIAQVYNADIVPNQMHGSAQAADINAVSGLSGFYTFCRTIRPEYANIIDNYFSRYGYKTLVTKTPNLTGRQSWNYVKTIGAMVTGNIPAPAARKIEEILNNGATFWHSFDVGNYTLSNNIV